MCKARDIIAAIITFVIALAVGQELSEYRSEKRTRFSESTTIRDENQFRSKGFINSIEGNRGNPTNKSKQRSASIPQSPCCVVPYEREIEDDNSNKSKTSTIFFADILVYLWIHNNQTSTYYQAALNKLSFLKRFLDASSERGPPTVYS